MIPARGAPRPPSAADVARTIPVNPIAVHPLGPPDPGAAGVLPESVTGLPRDLWAGSDPHRLPRQVAALPRSTVPAIDTLARTLMLAEADPPRRATARDAEAWLLARVDWLSARGALDAARALLDRAGARTLEAAPAGLRRGPPAGRRDGRLPRGRGRPGERAGLRAPRLLPAAQRRLGRRRRHLRRGARAGRARPARGGAARDLHRRGGGVRAAAARAVHPHPPGLPPLRRAGLRDGHRRPARGLRPRGPQGRDGVEGPAGGGGAARPGGGDRSQRAPGDPDGARALRVGRHLGPGRGDPGARRGAVVAGPPRGSPPSCPPPGTP